MQELQFIELDDKRQRMWAVAFKGRENAYAVYSNYKVGAAYEDEHGNIHAGCNVENAAYKGTCAEQGAISAMIAAGGRKVASVVIVLEGAEPLCGLCLQHTWQFCEGDKDVPIYLISPDRSKVCRTTIGELFPKPFTFQAPKES